MTEKTKRATRIDRRRVNLEGGGYIELAVNVDLFDLDDPDLEFVRHVIERFNHWEEGRKGSAVAPDGTKGFAS